MLTHQQGRLACKLWGAHLAHACAVKTARVHAGRPRSHTAASSNNTSSFTLPPLVILRAIRNSGKFNLAQFPGAGRGLQATQPIPYGTRLIKEAPVVCIPSPAFSSRVCYHCLGSLGQGSCKHTQTGKAFCSLSCVQAAAATYYAAEFLAQPHLLQQQCEERGERFPLLAARLGFMHISQAVGTSTPASGEQGQQQQQQQQQQPQLQGDALKDFNFLCYANINSAPQPWVEAYQALRPALSESAARLAAPAGSSSSSSSSSSMDGVISKLSLDWFVSTLARIHLNVFRIDTVALPACNDSEMHLFDDLAAPHKQTPPQARPPQPQRHPLSLPPEGSVGSGVFIAASLFNHACEPNVNVVFPQNNSTAAFVAARDIDPGEQLCISYIDSEAPLAARQEHLMFSYGFKCKCMLCEEQEAEQTGR